MNFNERYMQECIELAQQGLGNVAPNPMVGCVIVYEDRIIGRGYHKKYGEAHAEVNAIESVTDKSVLHKSTLYVNLEPCSHQGKTPPCNELIIQHRIPYIVIGCVDPNEMVKGKGIEKIVKAGSDVKLGILEDACKDLNKRFFTYQEKKRPYIILKWAQTIDGFIDIKRNEENIGKPTQISNEASRKLLHKWRSEEQAIMVGTNTALMDNPKLTVREWQGKNPIRIVLDKWLRIPANYHLFDKSTPTIVFTNAEKYSEENLEYLKIDFEKNIPEQILQELYNKEIQSIIIEGGEQLLKAFIQNNLWDEARIFIANKKFGNGVCAPEFSGSILEKENIAGDELITYKNKNQ